MHALLVIDVQKGLVAGAYNEAAVLQAINLAMSAVRDSGGLIVFIQHCHTTYEPLMKNARGWDLHPSLDARDADIRVEKEASDAFYETDLDVILKAAEVDHVYVTGLQTEFCVDATCRSALSHGYDVTLISDGHTTGDAVLEASATITHHNYALQNLAHPSRNITLCASTDVASQVQR